ncbi:hypothetical protein [Magnetospirillum molischianum]|uniref:Uncharacterized protein n=1 Tax=Magnetospirillum molischianum DSM 120 TaxID=1150626 RepID=H8FYB6_MAGML|nr:hypothetical protein [Magnetospirillum molischianum]CCG43354.1 hypothetical protein PHAMO_80145 [Magnetospirillum molischianum DSM 120]
MGERHFEAKTQGHDPEARVKQIAGLIRSLPYREMKQLGEEICHHITESGAVDEHNQSDVTEGLLRWAEGKVS